MSRVWSSYLAVLALSLASLLVCARAKLETSHGISDPRRLFALVVAGLGLALALAPPLDDLGDRFFSAHMVEHELFLYTIPTALLAAHPASLALVTLRRLPSAWRQAFGQASNRCHGIVRAASRIGHPIPALVLSGLALWVWHAPFLYDLALRNGWAHALEHISFLATALLYWRPLLNGRRRAAALNSNAKRTFYLLAGAMQGGFLGALIALSSHVIYVGYLTRPAASVAVVLADQRFGGAIMWFSGSAFCGAIAAAVMR